MQIVDSHVHFWNTDPSHPIAYDWLAGTPISKPFLPDDLTAHAEGISIEKIVFVEAGANPAAGVDEAKWVTSLAEQDSRIQAIVANAPLEQGDTVRDHLQALAGLPLVKGVRRLIQSEGVGFATQPDFVKGVQLLAEFDFSFDICIVHPQMQDAIKLVRQCPDVRFVLDHIGKPDIKAGLLDPWRDEIKTLAAFPNVYCKLSGLITEADHNNWTNTELKPYIDHVLDVFSMERVMYGGDWPVVTLAGTYPAWFRAARELLDESQHKQVFYDNAINFYRLG